MYLIVLSKAFMISYIRPIAAESPRQRLAAESGTNAEKRGAACVPVLCQ